MSNVIQFPSPVQPSGTYLCTVELWRSPSGMITGRLTDMPPEVVDEMGGEPSDKMVRLSIWMGKVQASFMDQAVQLKDGAGA